jgi:hypothetical protein
VLPPSIGNGRKRASLCPLATIRSKGYLKKIWTAILMPRQIYSSFYLCDPNLSIDMKGYYAFPTPDSFLIRKAVSSGPGFSDWK